MSAVGRRDCSRVYLKGLQKSSRYALESGIQNHESSRKFYRRDTNRIHGGQNNTSAMWAVLRNVSKILPLILAEKLAEAF